MATFTFRNQLVVGGNISLSAIYGPHSSIDTAKTYITDTLLMTLQKGMTIAVKDPTTGNVSEYWNPTDANTFVAKGGSGGGGIDYDIVGTTTDI